MRTYLRTFNPLIALLIFILCSFAAVKEEKDKPIVPTNIIAGGIPTYFFAKGIMGPVIRSLESWYRIFLYRNPACSRECCAT